MVRRQADHFDRLGLSERDAWRARLRYVGYCGDLEAAVDEMLLKYASVKAA